MTTYNLFSGIAKTLRLLHLCLALLFLSWILTRLPFAFRLSAHFLGSPLFLFAISNAIIAALLAQSGCCFSATATGTTDTDLISIISSQLELNSGTAPVAEQVMLQDKQVADTMKGEDRKQTARGKFRRSKTEKGRKYLYPHDKLSNEEFQCTIEAFIAKQIRMRREQHR